MIDLKDIACSGTHSEIADGVLSEIGVEDERVVPGPTRQNVDRQRRRCRVSTSRRPAECRCRCSVSLPLLPSRVSSPVADGALLDYESATSHDVTVRVTDEDRL